MILKNIYYVLMLSSLFILILRWKKLDSRLHIYLVILGSAILTEQIHDQFYPFPVSTYIYHIYQPIEMLFLSFYYYLLFKKSGNRFVVISVVTIFFAFYGYEFIIHTSNFYTEKRGDVMVENVCITIFSVLYLIELYEQDNPVVFGRSPHFWVVLANLVFSSGSTFFNGYTYYLLIHKIPLYTQLSYIIIALNYFLYTIYIIGFLCREKVEIS